MITRPVRANGKMMSRASCAIRINGAQRLVDVDSIDWSDEIATELVSPNVNNRPPLGVVKGNYGCTASIAIHADACDAFEQAALEGSSLPSLPSFVAPNLSGPRFQLTITMREEMRTRTVQLVNCVIVGRPSRTVSADGSGAIVKQYQLQPLLILEDGKTLVNTSALASAGFSPESDEHNHVVVAGVMSPGRAQISGLKVAHNWDVKESYGRDAAYMTYRGQKLARFNLAIALFELEHFLAWPAFAKLLEPPQKTSAPFVIEMGHPMLSAAGIKGVALLELGWPERQSNGLWVSTSSLIEWRPPKPVLVRPKGSIPSPDKGKVVTAKTEADRALEEAERDFAEARLRASQ